MEEAPRPMKLLGVLLAIVVGVVVGSWLYSTFTQVAESMP